MINTVALMGRLTYEPELKSTPAGASVIRFQIAVDRTYQKAGAERQTDFIDCVAWRQTAEFISRYFHKGSMIALTGEIQTGKYTDKNGNERKTVEVVANNVSFCGGRENAPQTTTESVTGEYEEIEDDEDGLPF